LIMDDSGRILGLDVGDARIGVAVSDPLGMIAQAHSVIAAEPAGAAIATIKALAEELNATAIVAGLPLDREGKAGHQAEKVLAFLDKLRAELTVAIETQDERFSTAGAERTLRDLGVSAKKGKGTVDKLAAQGILQTYLDRKANERKRAL
jgi:putative Holliday junction resolvase